MNRLPTTERLHRPLFCVVLARSVEPLKLSADEDLDEETSLSTNAGGRLGKAWHRCIKLRLFRLTTPHWWGADIACISIDLRGDTLAWMAGLDKVLLDHRDPGDSRCLGLAPQQNDTKDCEGWSDRVSMSKNQRRGPVGATGVIEADSGGTPGQTIPKSLPRT